MASMKVAVIEDHVPVRQLLVRRALKLEGLTVVAEASGEDEAVDAVMATTPDVVLLDLRLAQGSGLSVLTRLRGQAYPGRVFVLSGESSGVVAGLCRRHHRMKQHGKWRYRLEPDGTITWTSTSGSVRVTEPAHRLLPRPEPPPDSPREASVPPSPPPF